MSPETRNKETWNKKKTKANNKSKSQFIEQNKDLQKLEPKSMEEFKSELKLQTPETLNIQQQKSKLSLKNKIHITGEKIKHSATNITQKLFNQKVKIQEGSSKLHDALDSSILGDRERDELIQGGLDMLYNEGNYRPKLVKKIIENLTPEQQAVLCDYYQKQIQTEITQELPQQNISSSENRIKNVIEKLAASLRVQAREKVDFDALIIEELNGSTEGNRKFSQLFKEIIPPMNEILKNKDYSKMVDILGKMSFENTGEVGKVTLGATAALTVTGGGILPILVVGLGGIRSIRQRSILRSSNNDQDRKALITEIDKRLADTTVKAGVKNRLERIKQNLS